MSRPRTRPTRDETRLRLIDAAATVFAERGIAGASVEQIAAAAGFTRGAFYSNFATKEELAVAMLAEHLSVSQVHNRQLLAHHPDGRSLVEALRGDVERDDPLHRDPLLQVELMLYVARTPALRSLLGEHLRAMRELVGDLAVGALAEEGIELDVDPAEIGTVLVAIEDGLRLHRLIDPDSTSSEAFYDALDLLLTVMVRGREEARA
jgi:AcrR family transcriptional regulator